MRPVIDIAKDIVDDADSLGGIARVRGALIAELRAALVSASASPPAPYCDVCGESGEGLTGAVEVCRTCLQAEQYANERLREELTALRTGSASLRCEYRGVFSDGSSRCGLPQGHSGPHYSSTSRYPLTLGAVLPASVASREARELAEKAAVSAARELSSRLERMTAEVRTVIAHHIASAVEDRMRAANEDEPAAFRENMRVSARLRVLFARKLEAIVERAQETGGLNATCSVLAKPSDG